MAKGINFQPKFFASESDLENYASARSYENGNPGLCATLVIQDQPNGYNVKLRYDDNNYKTTGQKSTEEVPTTRKPTINTLTRYSSFNLITYSSPDMTSYTMYLTSGFTYLQYLVTKQILQINGVNSSLTAGLVPMQASGYLDDKFVSMAGMMMPFVIVLCYMGPIFRIISMIVCEKEALTREGMKMMGLKDSAYWLSLLAYYFIVLIVIALIISGISMKFMFSYSSWPLMFLYYLLYGLAVFSFGLLISSVFNRARVASITGAMLYFASYLLSQLVTDPTISETNKNAASLLPTISLTLGFDVFVEYEQNQYGLTFSNAGNVVDNYKFSDSIGLLIADFIIYFLLALYFDNVLPSPSGSSLPLYYFLTPDYWTGRHSFSASDRDRENEDDEKKLLYPNPNFEVDNGMNNNARDNCLKIRHLNKMFGEKHCVKDFSVDMFPGQIFALLGPNGAGKTTTLTMLAGQLPATSGHATLKNISVFEQMSQIREMLGVCPQHDVLFERLTAREHLNIFAAFKGRTDSDEVNAAVSQILRDVELNDVEDIVAGDLSGGQRRKLSIGIAFIGDSPMIFLDEPSSGMDMRARQKVWDILKKYKKDKIIILTTHYMEEAEVLGDRIGIMTLGALQCVGSPLFLKARFEVGYNVTMVMNEGCDTSVLNSFVVSHFPKSKISREAAKEITFHIPKNTENNFKTFFTELDAKAEELKIKSYGMASSTMEEIFLRVAKGDFVTTDKRENLEEEKESPEKLVINRKESVSLGQSEEYKKLEEYSLAKEPEPTLCSSLPIHFKAIFIKRLIITYRNWLTLLIELLVPAALIIWGFALTIIPTYINGPVVWFTPYLFQAPQSFLYNQNGATGNAVNNFISNIGQGFVASPVSVTGTSESSKVQSFDNTIFQSYNVIPSRYGSVYIDSIDMQTMNFSFAVFVNASSQDSSAAFLGFYLQSVVRTALNNSNYQLNFANAPLPLPYATMNMQNSKNGGMVASALVIAFALVPASIISFIVKEREDSLKHQQLISGVSMLAYWLSNAVVDVIKCLIPTVLAIIFLPAFNITLPYGWLLILLYGFSIIPFTYATSFIFNAENLAQIATLMLHFLLGVVLSQVFIIFKLFDSTRQVGIVLGWIFRCVPSFALSYGILNIS